MVSLVTCCMNRLEHLREAMPTWLGKGFAEIVIVDWSSTPPLAELVSKHQDGTLVLAELVARQDFFNQAKSKNLKMRLARHSVVCSLDCDVKILADDFLDRHPMSDRVFYAGGGSVSGSGIFHKADWRQFNGCNEDMTGWGFEDKDLCQRMSRAGWQWRMLCPGTVFHIPHGNLARVRNFPSSVQVCSVTARANRQIAKRASSWVQESFHVRIHRSGEAIEEALV